MPTPKRGIPVWATPERYLAVQGELATLEEKIGHTPQDADSLDAANRAEHLLYLGSLPEALAGFRQASVLLQQELDNQHGPGKSWGSYAESIATVSLLLHDDQAAREALLEQMTAIKERRGVYTDSAGGVGPGLLLWYVSIRQKDEQHEELALSYLRDIRKKNPMALWPRHLADFVVGDMSFEDVLAQEFKSIEIDELERIANKDEPPPEFVEYDPDKPPQGFMLRRQLARALFYGGVKIGRDKPDVGRDLLERCTRLRDVYLENEWYLAFLELGLFR